MKPDWQSHLVGELVELRPLTPADWEALYSVASDPLIWEQHLARDRWREDAFRQFFAEALESRGAFVVLDRATGRVIGSTRYYAYEPEQSEVEIGWTFLARSHWGGRYNGEMKRLMLNHAFQFVERVVLVIGQENIRSQRAAERIGATLRGVVNKVDRHGVSVPRLEYVISRPG